MMFVLFLNSSLSAYAVRGKLTLDLLPTGTFRMGEKNSFGTGKDDLDLAFAFGITGSTLFRATEYLDLGISLRSIFNVKQEGALGAGKVIDVFIPIKTHISPFENFELQPFVDVGLELLLFADASGVGPVVSPGLGLEYQFIGEKRVGLNLDISYSISWAKIDHPLVLEILGVNYLDFKLGFSYDV